MTERVLRPLGRTGLHVTRLGLGLAALGRPGYINLGHGRDLDHTYAVDAMEHRAHTVLDAAWEAGLRYVDVARSYGRAEHFLARWLAARDRPPKALTIGSKWGYTYTANWQVEAETHEVKAHTRSVLHRQWTESTALLGEALDLYQVHSATFSSGILERRDVLAALGHLKRTGVIIGLSLSSPQQADVLAAALKVKVDGEPLFQCVQATFNLLEPSAGAQLAEAHRHGLGVIVKEALANGRLTPRHPAFADALAPLQAQAERLGTTPDAVALAAILAQPWADVVLSGAATVGQLQSNVAALDLAWDAEADAALAPLNQSPAAYWAQRDALAWN